MKIPYGRSHFATIRERGNFYVDKTTFLPDLESDELGHVYLFFLRPRRFGKSTLLSMLDSYYDLGQKQRFDELFKGLWIHEHPTPERNSYLVLGLDFSPITTSADPGILAENFCGAVTGPVREFCMRYRAIVPELAVFYEGLDQHRDAATLMNQLLRIVKGSGHKLYVLIDEYDHFANRLLAEGSQDVYESIVKSTGFVRTFYTALKAGAGSGTVARMFITGVSPLLLDDLSSGFNIATTISTSRRFNALAGFTQADVERAIDEFLAARPELSSVPGLSDRAELLDVLTRHYDGYRFSLAATERVFNSAMVLYFFGEVADRGRYPDDMLDLNARTEYRHLQRIGTLTSTAADARRALLETILTEGGVDSDLIAQFGASSLSSDTQFISLLYYLGMLTLGTTPPGSASYRLEIPNRVIRGLQWEHLALMLKEQAGVTIDTRQIEAALHAMGMNGDIEPFLRLFHEEVIKKLGVKDTRRFDEKTLRLMLMTYISLSRMFHVLSEKELAQGYCDLFLGASRSVPDARYSWLLELKYLHAGAKTAQIEAAFAEAQAQVERYASDGELLPLLLGNRQLRAGMIVFVGTKKVLFRPWPRGQTRAPSGAEAGVAKKPAARRRPTAKKKAGAAGAVTRSPRKSAERAPGRAGRLRHS